MTPCEIAEALGVTRPPRTTPRGKTWTVRCPVPGHNDRRPSFDITDSNGRALFHCWPGCPQNEVIAALRERGLLSPTNARSATRPPVFRWEDHLSPEPPSIPKCCRAGGDSGASLCAHQRRFDADMTLARLRANLLEAKAEVVSLYRTAKLPLDLETLRAELNLAIEVGGGTIVPYHLDASIVGMAIDFVVIGSGAES
jgi:hypothetical protein